MGQFNIFISYALPNGRVINKLGCVWADCLDTAYHKVIGSIRNSHSVYCHVLEIKQVKV